MTQFTFSKKSADALATCHPDLQRLFNEVVKEFDCQVLEGHRDKEAQNKAFVDGKSKLKWPNGNHNTIPSMAVDVAPYPVDWNNRERFIYFGGYVMGVASRLGIKIRWGGAWSGEMNKPGVLDDLVHFEISKQGVG